MEKSICFISRYAHYVLMNRSDMKIGGAEFQQAIIARALRDRGWQVAFITEKIDTRKPFEIDGIRVFPAIDYRSGNPYVRRILKPPLELWKWMRKVNANIYYQRNPGALSAFIGVFCRVAGKQFVLAGANDANFDRHNELNVNSFLDVIEIKMGIHLAHKIILQNHRQKGLLGKNYRRNGTVFYNIYDPPDAGGDDQTPPDLTSKMKLLWVGRIAPQKRPDMCLHLARLLPDYEIIMVGSRTHHRDLSEKINQDVRNMKNIAYLGHLPLLAVEELFDSIHGLVNTSFVEGFPNTFLQAWSRGLPVFSFVDPDHLISENNLGNKVSSLEEMAAAIRRKLSDQKTYQQEANRIKSFFRNHFSVSNKIGELESLLCA